MGFHLSDNFVLFSDRSSSLIALQAAGYTHAWHSAYVLAQLLIGLALLAGFIIWEWKGARYPMIPSAIFQGQRVVTLVYIVAFVAGMNFYSFLNLFPFTLQVLYNPGPIDLGLKSFGFALGVGLGVPVGDALLGCVRGQVRIVLLGFAVMMSKSSSLTKVANEKKEILIILYYSGIFRCSGCYEPHKFQPGHNSRSIWRPWLWRHTHTSGNCGTDCRTR